MSIREQSVLSNFFWEKIHRSDESASFRWLLFIALTVALMPVIGSVSCFIFGGGALLSWFYFLFSKKNDLLWTTEERLLSVIFIGYIFITFIFSVSNNEWFEGVRETFNNLGFLITIPLMPVLRKYYRRYWMDWILFAIAAGGILTGVAGIAEVLITKTPRVEVFTGNALIYAYMAGVSGLMNGWLAVTIHDRRRPLFVVAFFSSGIALLLSGSRAPLAFFVVTAAVIGLFLLFGSARRNWWRVAFVAYISLFALTCAYVFFSDTSIYVAIALRFSNLMDTIMDPGIAGGDPALVARVEMYRAGLSAFLDHPVLAYGRQNVMNIANQQFADDRLFPYTHLHNAYITEAVSSGILGVIAFLAVLSAPLIAARNTSAQWYGLGLVLVAYTVVFNLTNIGFYHDIKVFYYCAFIVLLNCAPKTGTVPIVSKAVEADYADFLSHQGVICSRTDAVGESRF